ncbi:hypothetical protein [Micromonospora sediminicola]|uniref:hypothetical protein n=1 Tax=Micromonospora sediminicola TaxID=946078 RepID=UPI00378841D6
MPRTVTLTGRVRDRAGNVATKTVTITVAAPMTVGRCPKNSNVADLGAMLQTQPNPKAVRLYTDVGGGIAQWGAGILPMVPGAADLHYSWKDWGTAAANIAKLREHMTNRPAGRTGREYRTFRHEPEQGTAAGDLPPATWRQYWGEILAGIADHPRRGEFRFGPVFTEDYVRRNEALWRSNFASVLTLPGVDFAGWDVYDTGYERYRGAVGRNAILLRLSREFGLPVVIGEWGIKRKLTLDNGAAYDADGSLCAQEMRDNVAYLRQQADVESVMWFWRGECVLDEPVVTEGKTITRDKERAAFLNL